MAYEFLESEPAFTDFLTRFQQGTLPRPLWTHAAHLAIGAWHLLSYDENEAIQRVRTGIRHYNECAGIQNTADSGYHETLTRFWLENSQRRRKICIPARSVSSVLQLRRSGLPRGPRRLDRPG